MTTPLQLYDTTLRDGMQGEGMSLSVEERLRLVHKLDELGIDLIEAGFPSSNPKDVELFELLATQPLATPGCGRWPRTSRPCAPWSARAGRCTSRRSCAWTARRTCA